jgi:hypothetical protein
MNSLSPFMTAWSKDDKSAVAMARTSLRQERLTPRLDQVPELAEKVLEHGGHPIPLVFRLKDGGNSSTAWQPSR